MNSLTTEDGDETAIDRPAKKKQKIDDTQQGTSTAIVGFSSLPKEVVGTLSTFLVLEDVSNLVRSIKREQSETVKPSFLKRKFHFFTYNEPMRPLDLRPVDYPTAAYMKAWIEVNHDWKEMYDNPEQHGLLTKSDKIQFGYFFNNIVVATSLNMLVVVQHLIDNHYADINEHVMNGPYLNGERYSGRALLAALVFPSVEIPLLKFLLSTPMINANEMLSAPLLSAIQSPSLTPEKLRCLLKHPNVDVNIKTTWPNYTPLHLVCTSLDSSSEWKARMLIEEGADVNIRTITPILRETALEIVRGTVISGDEGGSDQKLYKRRMIELLSNAL